MIKLDMLQSDDYLTLKEQLVTAAATKEQFEAQFDNLMAISLYEKKIFEVVASLSEIIFAYPMEQETGMYVIAVNGKIITANNRRGIASFLNRFELDMDKDTILVHKLGADLNFGLHTQLSRENYALKQMIVAS